MWRANQTLVFSRSVSFIEPVADGFYFAQRSTDRIRPGASAKFDDSGSQVC